MDTPTVEWLKAAASGKLTLDGPTIAKALRFQGHVQVIDRLGGVLTTLPDRSERAASFRLTRRGQEMLDADGDGVPFLPFSKTDPPISIKLWASAFRRWCRNCPEGLRLAYSEGQLHVLAEDTKKGVANDDLHRLASAKVPWYEEQQRPR